MVFHFVIPFVVLLGRGAKSNRKILATMALWLLFCRWVELIWLVVPAWSKSGLSIHPLDIVMPVALGGIWVWCSSWVWPATRLCPCMMFPSRRLLHES